MVSGPISTAGCNGPLNKMDASTLTLHTAILRLLKGGVSAYETWIDEQRSLLVVESLRERKRELSREPLDKQETTR